MGMGLPTGMGIPWEWEAVFSNCGIGNGNGIIVMGMGIFWNYVSFPFPHTMDQLTNVTLIN